MSNVGKTFELREFVAMLKSNLKSEELLYLEKEFHDEVVQRASAIVVLIPGIENIFYYANFCCVFICAFSNPHHMHDTNVDRWGLDDSFWYAASTRYQHFKSLAVQTSL